MAELRNLLVTSFMVILQTIKDSTCKSVRLNLNLAPEWKAQITRRASDHGNLLLNLENLIGFYLIWMIALYVKPCLHGGRVTLLYCFSRFRLHAR